MAEKHVFFTSESVTEVIQIKSLTKFQTPYLMRLLRKIQRHM